MQKLRPEQAVFVMAFKTKAVYNHFRSQNILNLTFTFNFIFNVIKQCLLLTFMLWLFAKKKKSRMDEEQSVFKLLTLNDFKISSSTALKTFNNSSIIMTNIKTTYKNHDYGPVFPVVNFWVKSTGDFVEIHVVFDHFEYL